MKCVHDHTKRERQLIFSRALKQSQRCSNFTHVCCSLSCGSHSLNACIIKASVRSSTIYIFALYSLSVVNGGCKNLVIWTYLPKCSIKYFVAVLKHKTLLLEGLVLFDNLIPNGLKDLKELIYILINNNGIY